MSTQMRGINLDAGSNTEYTKAQIQKFAQWGFNTVRFFFETDYGSAWDRVSNGWSSTADCQAAFLVTRATDAEPYTAQMAKLKGLLDLCALYNINVIVNVNRCVGRYNFELHQDAMDEHEKVWGYIIDEVATGYPALWGCEISNECGSNDYETTADWIYWEETTVPAVLAIIRAGWSGWVLHDPRDRNYTIDGHLSMELDYLDTVTLLNDSKIIYVQHMYYPLMYCQNDTYTDYDNAEYPVTKIPLVTGDILTKADLVTYLTPLVNFKTNNSVPIMVGEFSTIRWIDGKDQWIIDCLDLFETYGFNWCYHGDSTVWAAKGFNADYTTTEADEATRVCSDALWELQKQCTKNVPESQGGIL